jgi:hypothetical protein
MGLARPANADAYQDDEQAEHGEEWREQFVNPLAHRCASAQSHISIGYLRRRAMPRGGDD